ncbi:hypothetical protein [Jatrophihabitans sp.]|jgi:hypothetical protein|uniref:hypothetical protein n=1 Tax=Jatrophihabitans sp. TaxID=1932789 RepID=UPI002EEB0C8D
MADRRSVAAFAVVLLATLVAGCNGPNHGKRSSAGVSSAGASSASPSPLPPATFVGPLTRELRYKNAGFDLRPPGGRTASASWAQAYATCLTGAAICDRSIAPTIALALVTDPNSGQTQPDGSTKLLLEDTLAYVITYVGVPCRATGGLNPISPRRTASPAPVRCTVLNFVSAADANVIYSFQGPQP